MVIKERRQRKKRSQQLIRVLIIELIVLCAVVIAGVVILKSATNANKGETQAQTQGSVQLESRPTEDTEPTDPPTEPTEPPKPEPPAPPTDPSWKIPDADRTITARTAFYYCVNRDELTIKNGQADEKIYPASVTKLLSVHVAMQYMAPDEKVTIGNILDLVSWDASVAYFQKGDVVTVEQLIGGMLLPSGNDAAYALAEAAAKKISGNSSLSGQAALDVFMDKVNEEALKLGMTNTHFTNPCGFTDTNHYTTINDLVILAKVVLNNELIMKYAGDDRVSVTVGNRVLSWENTNRLLDPYSEYYCPLTIGLKTGYTAAAGDCLLTAVEWDGFVWVIGTFGCPSKPERNTDTLQLINEALGIGAK